MRGDATLLSKASFRKGTPRAALAVDREGTPIAIQSGRGTRSGAEHHAVGRLSWLRAAVLGANDGILSTASLIVGVASAAGTHANIVVAGLSGLVAGAMSMAAGEYVSVSSQADSEQADLARERRELEEDRPGELLELAGIYVRRGLDNELALRVAGQLMEHDALGAHERDELGISAATRARPVQAALASAASFSIGAALPLVLVLVIPPPLLVPAVSIASLILLALLGAVAARAGGAPVLKATLRVTFWGALALAVTAAIGAAFGSRV
jgi:VIT1/CCC1 family predicted Fe2+/Mn2+ transporter